MTHRPVPPITNDALFFAGFILIVLAVISLVSVALDALRIAFFVVSQLTCSAAILFVVGPWVRAIYLIAAAGVGAFHDVMFLIQVSHKCFDPVTMNFLPLLLYVWIFEV